MENQFYDKEQVDILLTKTFDYTDGEILDKAIYKINNIDELRKTEGKFEGQVIELLGYYKSGDKKSVKYKWKNSIYNSNDGSIISVNNGSWHLTTEPDIKDLGSKSVYSFDGYKEVAGYNTVDGKFLYINGRLLIMYRKTLKGYHNHNDGAIYGKWSDDEGYTWSNEFLILDNDNYDIRNFLVCYNKGVLHLVYRLYDVNLETFENTHIGVYSVKTSDFDFFNWSTPVEVDRKGCPSAIPYGSMFVREDGYIYFLMYSTRNPKSSCHLFRNTFDFSGFEMYNEVYNIEDDSYVLSEPQLQDIGNGKSIILIRNSNSELLYNSFFQVTSPNGYSNWSNIVKTNLMEDVAFADLPVWMDVNDNKDLIVYGSARVSSISDANKSQGFRVYIQNAEDVYNSPLNYKLYNHYPRPFSGRTSTYSYPSTIKTSYGYLGAFSERRRVNDTIISITARYGNEADNTFVFRLIDTSYNKLLKKFGSNKKKNVITNIEDTITTDNDRLGNESTFNYEIWKTNITDPTLYNSNSSSARLTLLSSTNNDNNTNYPQDTKGGIIISAESSRDGVKWLLGRGNSNSNTGSIFLNVYNSSTKLWTGWLSVLTESNFGDFATNKYPSLISWDQIDRTKGFQLNATSLNSPGSISHHGFYIPQGVTGNYGTYLMFRNGKGYIRSIENNVVGTDNELITDKVLASTSKVGVVKQSSVISPTTTADATDLATALTLVNELKSKNNDLLAKLKAAGIMSNT